MEFLRKKHIQYLNRILNILPSHYIFVDMSRVTFAYFAISGLDLLGGLDEMSTEDKQHTIEWIYSVQVTNSGARSGFLPSTTLPKNSEYRCGHLASTYTGLATLLILGDDLSRVDKKSIIEGLRACQTPDGCFICTRGCESDMRFIYCACCISFILNDWSGIDKRSTIDYILNSINYDGGIGQGPGLESHGGSTFCAIASLYLMNELDNVFSTDTLEKLKRWLIMRQESGFNGRPGKPPDTCYSYWVGATLQMLGIIDLSDFKLNRIFVLSTQDLIIGGLAKYEDAQSDLLHTYLGLCGLSLLEEDNLEPLHSALNISQRAYTHLKEIHKRWEAQ